MASDTRYYGTGRRKTSVARVWLKAGGGNILVNRRAFEEYFPRETLRMVICQPLQLTSTLGQFDANINVGGGGPSGQAGAVRHGIARALLQFDEQLRQTLKRAGLTRDPACASARSTASRRSVEGQYSSGRRWGRRQAAVAVAGASGYMGAE